MSTNQIMQLVNAAQTRATHYNDVLKAQAQVNKTLKAPKSATEYNSELFDALSNSLNLAYMGSFHGHDKSIKPSQRFSEVAFNGSIAPLLNPISLIPAEVRAQYFLNLAQKMEETIRLDHSKLDYTPDPLVALISKPLTLIADTGVVGLFGKKAKRSFDRFVANAVTDDFGRSLRLLHAMEDNAAFCAGQKVDTAAASHKKIASVVVGA